jgi:hypothetical protein
MRKRNEAEMEAPMIPPTEPTSGPVSDAAVDVTGVADKLTIELVVNIDATHVCSVRPGSSVQDPPDGQSDIHDDHNGRMAEREEET